MVNFNSLQTRIVIKFPLKKYKKTVKEGKGLIGFGRFPAEWNHLLGDNPLTFRILEAWGFAATADVISHRLLNPFNIAVVIPLID